MGKKRKTEHSYEVVVEESREPASYTVGGSDAAAATQQQQQQAEYQPAEQHAGNGYGYDDYGEGGEQQQSYHYASGPGGSRIDPDTLSYLTEVCEALAGMSDPEEASLLRANVLEEVSGKELSLATDAASAALLEQLLGGAPASQLIQFMSAFTDGDLLWRCAGAAFGSHVSEKVLAWLHAAAATAATAAADEDGSSGSSSSIEGLEQLLESLVAAVEPHIVDYATDKHATHVARALLVAVTGRDVLTPPGKKQRQRQQQAQQGGSGEGEEGAAGGQQQQQQQQAQHKGVFGKQRSSLAEKMQSIAVGPCTAAVRYPSLLRRLVKALPLFDPQQMSALGKNTYGGPLLQAMLRAAAQDESLLMLLLPPVLGLDPSKAAAAAPGQRLATLTDSHVGRLLRDDCYSHLLEVAVAVMPQQAVAAPAEGASAADEDDQQDGHSNKKKKKRKLGDAAGEQQEEDGQTPAAAAAGGKGLSLADEFYDRFLKGRLLPLCCHHCANFVIQAVLASTSNKARVAAYVAELAPHLPDLMRRRRSGVVAALAAAAARAGPGPHQQLLVEALSNALGQQAQWQGRTGTAHLAPALMALDTQAVFGAASGSSGSSTRLSTPGCAMLALLLGQFTPNVVAPFWDSMGALPQGDVVRVAKDPSGSRVLEAALAVPAAQEGGLSKRKLRKLKKQKQHQADGSSDAAAAAAAAAEGAAAGDDAAAAVAARGALLDKLRGSWGVLVQTPSGSFLLESVYNNTTPEQAEALVAEVAAVSDQLMSRCSWGALVARKLGLEAYQRCPEEWRKRAAAAATTRKEFQQLLSTTTGGSKHSKTPAAAAAVADADGAQQEQQLAEKGGKKKRRREEAAAAAAAGNGTVAVDAAAAAGEEDAAVSNAKKRARLAAAALAAAEAADTAEGSGEERQQQQKRKKQKKRKLSQPDAAAAAEAGGGLSGEPGSAAAAQPPKKKAKKDKQQAELSKKKRSRDSAGSGAAATGGGGGDVDLVALLGFGGLSADKQHSSKKHKK